MKARKAKSFNKSARRRRVVLKETSSEELPDMISSFTDYVIKKAYRIRERIMHSVQKRISNLAVKDAREEISQLKRFPTHLWHSAYNTRNAPSIEGIPFALAAMEILKAFPDGRIPAKYLCGGGKHKNSNSTRIETQCRHEIQGAHRRYVQAKAEYRKKCKTSKLRESNCHKLKQTYLDSYDVLELRRKKCQCSKTETCVERKSGKKGRCKRRKAIFPFDKGDDKYGCLNDAELARQTILSL